MPAPGADLFATLRRELGDLPLIAEDLGLITPEVEARDATAAADLTGIWEADAPPDEAGLQAAVAALDAIFPCPQCESCTPETEWGY